MISKDQLLQLIRDVKKDFKLDINGIHGIAHWSRVFYNTRFLYYNTKDVDSDGLDVILLFPFIHDSQRCSDSRDDVDHGVRAASFAEIYCQEHFDLTPSQLGRLTLACAGHTTERFNDDPIVQICWDADRLDIGRCKEFIDSSFLGTSVAKHPDVIKMMTLRSRNAVAKTDKNR
jgi:uncharacterized protein